VGKKCGRRRTALIASTKFAWSGHPSNILLTSYGLDRHDCVWLPPLVNCIGKYDFHHLSAEPDVEEEETMRMPWKQIVSY